MNGTDTKVNTEAAPEPADAPGKREADSKGILSEHKGKLAIGVAATLGVMIYYNWRQKNLPKEDPEAYARLKRLKDSIKASETQQKQGHNSKHRKTTEDK